MGQAADVHLQEVPYVAQMPVEVDDALGDFVGAADIVGPGCFYQRIEVAFSGAGQPRSLPISMLRLCQPG